MSSDMNDRVNSLFYWSHRFEGDWESNGGRAQSRFFCRLAVREMPGWLTAAIRRNRLTVCDWGCALGDGTDVLAHALGTSVTGIDFSEVAITKARESYSKPRFLAIDLLSESVCETWDVMFSSNTVEHFAEPWRTLTSIARFATSVLVVLVPYREFERHCEHEYTFLDTNIPLIIGAFELRHVALVDAASEPGSIWSGDQILLVYTSREFAEELSLCLGDIRVDGDWTSKELERLRREVSSMQDARLAVEERDCQLANLQKTIAELEQQMTALGREREKALSRERESRLIIAEREARIGAQLEHLRSEAADRNYWETRARALENSTSWRVTSSGRALKTAAVFALQPAQIGKRLKHLREVARTRGLAAAGASLWHRLSERQEQRTPASGVRSANGVAASEPGYDIHQDGRSDELKTYLRERSYTGVFVMGSRNMGWHEVFKQRHHHIADYLMSRGYLVLCAMNPIYPEDSTAGVKQDSENLFLVNFDDRQIWGQIIELLAVESRAALYYHLVGTEPGTTFEEIHELKRLGYVLVYDYLDEVTKDIYADLSDFCIARHDALLRDEEILVLTSSDNLHQKATDRRSKNLICAPNGVRLEDWLLEENAPIPEEIAEIVAEGKPIVGYYGSFATWMNYDYVHALSHSRSDVNIVMIGYDYEWGRGAFTRSRISELPNVHVVPAQKYHNLKYFSRFFDVGIIPFRDYELTKSVSPVKMFEYMAQGIPIVASGLEECRKYASCLIAESAGDFVVKVGHALTLKDDAAYMEQLRREAEANTWAARGEMIETAMTTLTTTEPGKLLTITVPTYNMETLLPRCLDSILPSSQLQRLEIIIVNDGSKDGSLTIARQYEARFPEVVRVIDKANGGHGSALNAGIREAKGKYYKVVDADDWLHPTALVAHLVFLARHDADMVVTNYMRTYDDRRGDLVLYSDRLQQKEYASDDFYRALMADASHLSYAHMHAITYRTKILQDNYIVITEKSFYVDQEYISFPQKFVENVWYQDIILYQYYNGRSGQSVAPDVACRRAPENLKILQNILAYCDSLPRGSELRAYTINIAYHQTWFYLTFSDDNKAKLECIRWWKENHPRHFRLLNEQFRVIPLEVAQ